MHTPQLDVEDLHRALGHTIGPKPDVRDVVLRQTLIKEEAREFLDALDRRSLEGIIKESCDVLVVTYGTAVACGVDIEPFWKAIHASNLQKAGGPRRPDGKAMKPPGWQPPSLAPLLTEQLARPRVPYGELN